MCLQSHPSIRIQFLKRPVFHKRGISTYGVRYDVLQRGDLVTPAICRRLPSGLWYGTQKLYLVPHVLMFSEWNWSKFLFSNISVRSVDLNEGASDTSSGLKEVSHRQPYLYTKFSWKARPPEAAHPIEFIALSIRCLLLKYLHPHLEPKNILQLFLRLPPPSVLLNLPVLPLG